MKKIGGMDPKIGSILDKKQGENGFQHSYLYFARENLSGGLLERPMGNLEA